MGQPVIHWEMAAKDPGKLQEFYAALFDWKINANNPMNYGLVETGGEGGINGGIYSSDREVPPLTIYIHVDDLQTYLDKAEGLGGKTVLPPTPIPGVGACAMFSDPEGTVIGLFTD